MDYFKLTRNFWDFSFENPEKIKPNHCALYLFIVEHCNRLGWKRKFGLPTTMAKDAIGIRSYNTYIKTLNDLVEFGLIEMIEVSKNQYSSNIVAISNFNKALNKALDKASIKHVTKQSESTVQSIYSIDKHNTNIQSNNIPIYNNKATPLKFSFYNCLVDYGFQKDLVNDWIKVRKTKKATNTQTAFNNFIKEIEKRNCNLNEILEFIVSKNWSGFKWEWHDKENNFNQTNDGKQQFTNTGTKKQFRFSTADALETLARQNK